MIRVALFLLAAVSFGCLIFTPIGLATAALAVCGGVPTIALIVLWREPAPKRPGFPYLGRQPQKWDPIDWALSPNPETSSIPKEPSS